MQNNNHDIKMVDLQRQYVKIQEEIDNALLHVVHNTNFINGIEVNQFANNLSSYLGISYVIPCANGTDALQIALMSLNLEAGDEIIVPSFTYVATAEVIGLLKLRPVMIDVNEDNFNLNISAIENAITVKTKAIVPVHLFGQCANMEQILEIAEKYNLFVIEDAAQAMGAVFENRNGIKKMAGTIGHIGCTSFFPSKNLGCYGDGGAIFTDDKNLAEKIKMIANHGQEKKYVHKIIGVNSRLDTIQASILNIKLKYLDQQNDQRLKAADIYNSLLSKITGIKVPLREVYTSHVFHQYTIQVKDNKRDSLKEYLEKNNIPSMIYYPVPLNEQEAFKGIGKTMGDLPVTSSLCSSVLSLPMHPELTESEQVFICETIKSFYLQ